MNICLNTSCRKCQVVRLVMFFISSGQIFLFERILLYLLFLRREGYEKGGWRFSSIMFISWALSISFTIYIICKFLCIYIVQWFFHVHWFLLAALQILVNYRVWWNFEFWVNISTTILSFISFRNKIYILNQVGKLSFR